MIIRGRDHDILVLSYRNGLSRVLLDLTQSSLPSLLKSNILNESQVYVPVNPSSDPSLLPRDKLRVVSSVKLSSITSVLLIVVQSITLSFIQSTKLRDV